MADADLITLEARLSTMLAKVRSLYGDIAECADDARALLWREKALDAEKAQGVDSK